MKLFLSSFLLLIPLALAVAGNPPSPGEWESFGFRPIPGRPEIPEIEFKDLSGEKRSLGDFRGSVVLLNFWASWCPPCRAEIPSMEVLDERLSGTDFVMAAINVGESPDLIRTFVKEFDVGIQVFSDEGSEAARIIGVSGLPTSIMVDRQGRAAAVVTGAVEWDREDIVAAMEKWGR